ncbi:hypothetical protein ABEF92_004657 [Exophiala dermatitidis]|nr:hypothetical protein HRR75_000208 [Exophiala dermatitidis]KAJ4549928.1 hypothetical protein HRR78_004739 [Exophiala dermatitidis]
MRSTYLLAVILLGWALAVEASGLDAVELIKKQDTATATASFPSLTTDAPPSSTDTVISSESSTSSGGADKTSTDDGRSSDLPASATPTSQPTTSATKASPVTTSILSTSSPANSHATAAATTSKHHEELPLKPEITPAFGIAGVLLIILGSVYALVGVKSKWVQISLSAGFLASIATTALLVYVMDPPVKNTIQGGYFVAIVMTGVIFGAGALVFKEFTEGLGCLLGGYCFSMWLLTLKPGGLITSAIGKGVFIGIFCLIAWAVSWTRYTRPYGLIGSTSFGGATAFILGIDCFTKAGMKEFWIYIWDLNDNLFPLNTDTYPQTRGMRVEIAVVVIGTIIGLLSQIKLWKVIKSRQKELEVLRRDDDLNNDAIEAALGRHLQRQNEREKSVWERQYGDRLQSQRNTILWQNAHPEKQHPLVSVVTVPPGPTTPPEDVEMEVIKSKTVSSSGSKRNRHRSVIVDVIEEVEEDPEENAAKERQKALEALEERDPPPEGERPSEPSTPLRDPKQPNDGEGYSGVGIAVDPVEVEDPSRVKRLSRSAMSGLTKRLSPTNNMASKSREYLLSANAERPQSRASSAAATVDTDNEDLDVSTLDDGVEDGRRTPDTPPEIIVSPATPTPKANWTVTQLSPRHQQDPVVEEEISNFQSTSEASLEDVPPLQQSSAASVTASLRSGSTSPSEKKSKLEDAGSGSGKSRSQASEATGSSAESLTRTALAQIPSQLSNVVLSYRTNEWAKHIGVADIPICDEPDTLDAVDDDEPAVHLASSAPDVETGKDPNTKSHVSGLSMAPPVKAGSTGVGITSVADPIKRRSSQEKRRSSGGPIRSGSIQSLPLRDNSRSSRHSFHPESLVTTPIDENAPSEFHPHNSISNPNRRASAGPRYIAPSQRRSTAPLPNSTLETRPYTAHGRASASTYTGTNENFVQINRPLTQQDRAASYDYSRQQPRRKQQDADTSRRSDIDRRQSLLAEWRLSQHYRATSSGLGLNGASVSASADAGRAMMRAEKENQRLKEEYERAAKREKQLAIDQAMRRPDMQELHREAMRKMQANANKKLLRSSSNQNVTGSGGGPF